MFVFRKIIFQIFLCLFVIRKVGQRKTHSGQRKTLSSQRKIHFGQRQSISVKEKFDLVFRKVFSL